MVNQFLCKCARILPYTTLLLSHSIVAQEHGHSRGPQVGGRLQIWGVGQHVKDDYRDPNRLYLFVKQARLRMSGEKDFIRYNMQLGFSGSESVVISKTGVSLNLLDISADMALTPQTFVKVGQFKVPYSREQLSSSGSLLFAERSILRLPFDVRRDAGVALHSYHGPFALAAGVFTGGGRDIPERFLPEKLGVPLLVARLGLSTLDKNIFEIEENSRDEGYAVFANALYTKDSLIGHSTVLNVELDNKGLLTNPNWNPYIGKRPFEPGRLLQYGVDAVYKRGAMSLAAEYNFAKYFNEYGEIKHSGWLTHINFHVSNVDLGVRYASFKPDTAVAYSYVDAQNNPQQAAIFTEADPIQELTPALTYHFAGRSAKLIFDLPYMIGVPVALEKDLGSYILTDHPDQVALLGSGGSVERQNVLQARMLFQVSI